MQIYVAEGTQQTGPFDLETIKTGLSVGKYQPAQLAWYEGAPGWEPISMLPGMEAFVAPPPPPPMAPVPTPPAYSPPPPSFIPVATAPYVPGPGTVPPKRGVMAIVGSVCLGLLAVLLGVARVARIFTHHSYGSSISYVSTPRPSTPAPSATTSAPTSSFFNPASPASGTRHFSPKRSNYSGDLADHFVAFSFDYPEDWTLKEDVSDSYFALKHFVRQPNGKNVQAEFVSFSYAYNQPGYPMSTTLNTLGADLLATMVAPLLNDSPQATKTPARSGHFGRYASEEILVTDKLNDNKTGMYSRLAIVAQPNASNDAIGINFISSELAGSKSAETLGASGGLRTIQDSFRFGP